MSNPVSSERDRLAAMYVRMSTERQQYSTEHQEIAIRKYASDERFEIVKKYEDCGKSGLTLSGRPALRDLLRDVESGNACFGNVLVYDVSRWGRFQDADESAYYEHLCRRARVFVHYCAEAFPNDGSLTSTLLKALKRSMAGEYSRELSVKVFAGQTLLVKQGFRLGGLPGYGLRRQVIDRQGVAKMCLDRLERKSIQTDRTILVPGPPEELAVVAEIYQSFIEGQGECAIAASLNAKGIDNGYGRPWTNTSVHGLLTNPKYIGTSIFNRTSRKLQQKRIINPREMWISIESAFTPIVSLDQFRSVQQIMAQRCCGLSDTGILDRMTRILKTKGRLSYSIINEATDLPQGKVCAKRFGGIRKAYALIGYSGKHDLSFIATGEQLLKKRSELVESIVAELRARGAEVTAVPKKGLVTISRELLVFVLAVRCVDGGSKQGLVWKTTSKQPLDYDVCIIARMCLGNESILDYFVLPVADAFTYKICLHQFNPLALEAYRFESLNPFLDLCKRKRIGGTM